jgi:multidrug efflux pump
MTSLATVFGHLPLTLVTGAGAASRNSIGLIVVGGMAIGTFFTLFVVPALYLLIARDHASSSRRNVRELAEESTGDMCVSDTEVAECIHAD